jgi:LuxR family transcriptional regulator, maltose regulon positive regulatory protein
MTGTFALLPSELDRSTLRRRRPLRLRSDTPRRERLLRRLGQSNEVPLILIVAPAGYGKTTLLSHWLADDPRQTAWVEIDEADDDPDRLMMSIALALAEPVSDDLTLSGFAGAIARRQEPFVLVLDDLQVLRSPEALAVVTAVADTVPAGSQVILASRQEPLLPIGRLARGGN